MNIDWLEWAKQIAPIVAGSIVLVTTIINIKKQPKSIKRLTMYAELAKTVSEGSKSESVIGDLNALMEVESKKYAERQARKFFRELNPFFLIEALIILGVAIAVGDFLLRMALEESFWFSWIPLLVMVTFSVLAETTINRWYMYPVSEKHRELLMKELANDSWLIKAIRRIRKRYPFIDRIMNDDTPSR